MDDDGLKDLEREIRQKARREVDELKDLGNQQPTQQRVNVQETNRIDTTYNNRQTASSSGSGMKSVASGLKSFGKSIASAYAGSRLAGGGSNKMYLEKKPEVNITSLLIFSFIMLIIDYALGFNGIDPKKLAGSFMMANFIFIILLVVVGILMYAIINRPSRDDLISSLILTFIIATILVYTNVFNVGTIIHLAFGYYVYFSLIKPTSETSASAKYTFILVLLFDFFFFAAAADFANRYMGQFSVLNYLFNRLSFPFWTVAILSIAPAENKTGVTFRKFINFILVLWMILNIVSQTSVAYADISEDITPENKALALEYYQKGWEGLRNLCGNIKEGVTSGVTRVFKTAMGDTYSLFSGEVQEQEKLILGVTIESLKADSKTYYLDEVIGLSGSVVARPMKKEFDITHTCYEKHGDKTGVQGLADPTLKKIKNSEYYDFTCTFTPGALSSGTKTIEFKSSYEFRSMGENKIYLMQKSELDAQREKYSTQYSTTPDNAIMQNYGVTNTKPVTQVSGGPVNVGIGFERSYLFGVDPSTGDRGNLIINIQKNTGYEGKVGNIKELFVFLPAGIEFDSDKCTKFIQAEEDEVKKAFGESLDNVYKELTSEEPSYKFFKLTDAELQKPKLLDGDYGVNQYACWIKIKPEAVAGSGITQAYLRFFAVYDFETTKTASVYIKDAKAYSSETKNYCDSGLVTYFIDSKPLSKEQTDWAKKHNGVITALVQKTYSKTNDVKSYEKIGIISGILNKENLGKDISADTDKIDTVTKKVVNYLDMSISYYKGKSSSFTYAKSRDQVIERALQYYTKYEKAMETAKTEEEKNAAKKSLDSSIESSITDYGVTKNYEVQKWIKNLCNLLSLSVTPKVNPANFSLAFTFTNDITTKCSKNDILYKIRVTQDYIGTFDESAALKYEEGKEQKLSKGTYYVIARAYCKDYENGAFAESSAREIKITGENKDEAKT